MLEWGKVFGGDKDRLEATSLVLDLTLYLETSAGEVAVSCRGTGNTISRPLRCGRLQ